MSDVVTGEAVSLELRLAKLPSRALAILIDAMIYAAVGLALFAVVSAVLPGVDTALATALGLAATITLLVVVPATIETLTRGRSVGKIALGLRVVRDDGGPIRARQAGVRALSGVFADFILTSGVGAVFCSLLNERGKRIGDVLAGTVVVRERIPASPGLPPTPAPLRDWAPALELSRLPDDLALSARNYLVRLPQLAPHVRDNLGARLADEVASVVSPPPPPGVPAWAYLAAVLNERARRDTARYTGTSTADSGLAATGPGGNADQAQPADTGRTPPSRATAAPDEPPHDRAAQPRSDEQPSDATDAPDNVPSSTRHTGFTPPA